MLPPKQTLATRLPLRILAADDIDANRKVIAALCSCLGYPVTLADDGHAALARLAETPYDLLLLDLHMPGLDGLAVAREISLCYGSRRPRIIAISADTHFTRHNICFTGEIDDFIAKPIDLHDLYCRVARLFGIDTGDVTAAALLRPTPDSESRLPPLVNETYLRALLADFEASAAGSFLHDIYTAVLSDYRKASSIIATASVTQDADTIAQIVHGLKGSVATLGWSRMEAYCQHVLQELRARRFDEWAELPIALRYLFEDSCRHHSRSFQALGFTYDS